MIRIIAHKSYIEAEAIKQLHATAALPNMRLVVGLPDLHPGKGFPIGSASVSEDVIYPHLVGADIGTPSIQTKIFSFHHDSYLL